MPRLIEGVDYSFDRPNIPTLAHRGKYFAGRYFGAGTADKHATLAECTFLAANAMWTFAICEGIELAALQGSAVGRAHARLADIGARSAGMPPNRPIYFAVDFDAQPHEMGRVASYFDGAASVLGVNRVGAYAGIRQLDWLVSNGHARWGFQTYAWSHGDWSAHANIRQYLNGQYIGGGQLDLCRATTIDYGQWKPGVSGEIVDVLPPIPDQSTQGFDYSDQISGVARSIIGLAQGKQSSARAIDALRQ